MLPEKRKRNNFSHDAMKSDGNESSVTVISSRKRDWSKMSDDLIRMIASRITLYPSVDMFGCACKDWHRIKNEVLGEFPLKTPLMLLPYDSPEGTCVFSHHTDSATQALYQWKLPCNFEWILSSSNGWFVMTDKDINLSLIDPVTRTHVPLPSPYLAIKGLLQNLGGDPEDALDMIRHIHLPKVAIQQTSLDLTPKCQVAAIIYPVETLFVCQLGDEAWTPVMCSRHVFIHQCFKQVVFFKGTIYAFGDCDGIAVIKYDGTSARISHYIFAPEHIGFEKITYYCCDYLVECCDNLLFVTRILDYSDDDFLPSKTRSFIVFKFVEENNTWVRVYNLEDFSLFVNDENSSFSVCAKDMTGCRPNCIYFIDDNVEWQDSKLGSGLDYGLFSLEDEKVETLGESQFFPKWKSPSWFLPSPAFS